MALLQQNMLKTQLQSARNSLLFMETEHAKTLKGLHSEIQHLQKKCSELTFDLAMKDAVSGAISASSGGDLQRELKRLEEEAVIAAQEKVCLLRQIENQDRKIMEMEKQSDFNNKQFINEIKSKKFHISNLMSELESRATTIQYLTTQLHQTRAKLHSIQHPHAHKTRSTVSREGTPSSYHSPAPPSSKKSPSHMRKSYMKSQSLTQQPPHSMSPAPPSCPKSPTQRRKSRTRKSSGKQSRTSTPAVLQSIPPSRRGCTSAPPRSPYIDGYLPTTHSYDDELLHHNDILHVGRKSSIDTSPYLPSTSASVSPSDLLDAETWGRQVLPRIPPAVLPPIQSHHREAELIDEEDQHSSILDTLSSVRYVPNTAPSSSGTTSAAGTEEHLAVSHAPVTMTTSDHHKTMATSGSGRHLL